ncbi:type II toxin-antitoxin system VapC family toxin [Blastococcus sp. SYSU DS0510]
MIVFDASVLIAHLDAEDAQHHKAESMLVREIDDEFAASALTLAEVLGGPSRTGRLDAARSALRELEIAEQPFPADTAVRLARWRADTGLRMPDCCVPLAAQDAAARLATFDERLVRGAEASRIGRNASGVRRHGARCGGTRTASSTERSTHSIAASGDIALRRDWA